MSKMHQSPSLAANSTPSTASATTAAASLNPTPALLANAQSPVLSRQDVIRLFYYLTKPGIIYGNAITAAASFLLAANGQVALSKFVATLLGMSLVIGAACVCNNYIDRELDKKMLRTQKRATARGLISKRQAFVYASALAITGFGLLAAFVNWLTVAVGVAGVVFYVIIYGWAKRKSVYGTEVGSISGALPIVAGYTAVTGRLDLTAGLLFLILVSWQMPHFYAIAIYRLKDYQAAGIPVWPAVRGIPSTVRRMQAYILLFACSTLALAIYGPAGKVYAVLMVAVSALWFTKSLQKSANNDAAAWARKLFGFSLITLLLFSLTLSLNFLLP
jgi:protoheme IX farnesyltransferase